MRSLLLIALCITGTPDRPSPDVLGWLQQGDLAYLAGDFASAAQAYGTAERSAPGDYGLLIRQVRLWNDLGRVTLRRSDSSEAYYRRAVFYAERLVQEHPDSAQGWFLLALSHGSLTPFKSLREKLEVARDVEANLLKALRLDPALSMAHVVLAIYYRGVAGLHAWERMVVNTLLGKGVRGSLDDAERSLLRAVELDPRNSYAWYEMYWLRRAQDRPAEAERALRTVLDLPAKDPRERHQHTEARDILGLPPIASTPVIFPR